MKAQCWDTPCISEATAGNISAVFCGVLILIPMKETISYNMPAFRVDDKIVIYFAACKAHIGMYPPVRGDAALKRAAAPYAGPKGNLQFPPIQDQFPTS